MPLQSEIVQRLSADNSQYRSVMNQSEQVADKVGKSIFKKLDLRAGITAVAVALGVNFQNIANGIARFVVGFSKDQEAALERLVDSTDKAARAQEAALEKARARQAKAAEEASEREIKQAQIVREALIKGLADEEAQRKKIRQNDFDAQVEADAAHMEAVKNNLELLTLEAKAKQGLTVEEAARLKTLKEQTAELGRQEQIAGLLSLNKRTPEEEALLQTLIRQSAQYKESLKTVGETKKEVAAIAPVIESNIAAWEKFIGVIKSTGRSDRDLSDRELERKIANINAELSAAQGRNLGTFQGAAGTGTSDFLSEQQRGAANQARAELDFRNQVRQAAATQGEDAAFRQFTGLSEQRFREILQLDTTLKDVNLELKKLGSQFKQGIPTVLFGSETNT